MTSNHPDTTEEPLSRTKWVNLSVLAVSSLFAMTLWFSASAVAQQLGEKWNLGTGQKTWITLSVQLGFVTGALISALLNLADRISAKWLFAISAMLGAGVNATIALFDADYYLTVMLRFLTGFTLAGVYPPGMKLVATWCRQDRGLGIGILVGALTIGSATPHLVAGLSLSDQGGLPPWKTVVLVPSGLALLAAVLMLIAFRPGPFFSASAPFNWKFVGKILSYRPTRLANFGYLGHMWELYAMWAWCPFLLTESYVRAGYSSSGGKIAGFGTIGIGALGCVLAGKLADTFGRTKITIISLAVSGACAMCAGVFFESPLVLTVVCLVWGFAAVADSAQFSTAVSELTDQRYVGTALTLQTSLGFLLTLASIHLIPILVAHVGWNWALMTLALGPAFGIWNMNKLRLLPEASQMANGHK